MKNVIELPSAFDADKFCRTFKQYVKKRGTTSFNLLELQRWMMLAASEASSDKFSKDVLLSEARDLEDSM